MSFQKNVIALDGDQEVAANHHTGSMLLVAGAGSGKTATIVERSARLIERGMPARQMLMLTFSRKACREMYARLADRLDIYETGGVMPTIETYHSFGYKLLRKKPELCGRFDGATLMDEPDSKKIFREAMIANDVSPKSEDVNEKLWRSIYEHTRNDGLDANDSKHISAIVELLDKHGLERGWHNAAVRVFSLYEKLKAEGNLVDYGDLQVLPVQALRKHPDWARQLGNYLLDIVVDESQDTNTVQYELVRLIGMNNPNRQVVMVGDDDQTIYGWRGARADNLRHFIHQFSPTLVRLERNYRSPSSIVEPAARLIANNQNRVPKRPYSALDMDGRPIDYIQYAHGDSMSEQIAKSIRFAIDKGLPPKQIAILYRTNRMAKVLEPALIAHNIPYRIQQGFDLFERKEVQMLFACVRLAVNKRDYPAFKKLATLVKGFGEKRVNGVIDAFKSDVNCPSLFEKAADIVGVTSQAGQAIEQMGARIKQLMLLEPYKMGGVGVWALDTEGGDFGPWLKTLARATDNPLKNLNARVDSLLQIDKALRSKMAAVDMENMSVEDQWAMVIEMCLATPDEEDDSDTVVLSTVHKMKGLEFAYVHVAGFSDGLMPSLRDIDRDNDEGAEGIEEERRLAYVAITRAKRKAVLHHADRVFFGYETVHLTPSRFAAEAGLIMRQPYHRDMEEGQQALTKAPIDMETQLRKIGWKDDDFDVFKQRQHSGSFMEVLSASPSRDALDQSEQEGLEAEDKQMSYQLI